MMFNVHKCWKDADTDDDYSSRYICFHKTIKGVCKHCDFNKECNKGYLYVDCTIKAIKSPYEAFAKAVLLHRIFLKWIPRGVVLDIFKEFKLNKAVFNADYTLMYMDLTDYDGFHDYVVCDVTLLPMPTKDLLFPYISHVDRIYKNNFDALEDVVDLTAEMLANNYSIPKISIDK